MHMTKHIQQRLSQRGIKHSMLDLVIQFGKQKGSKCILNRKGIDSLLRELEKIKKDALKMRERGGVVVVTENDALITTYGVNG